MSTEVDRARGLEREGIQTDRVRWNLSTAVLYEEAVRRREGMVAASGPLACRTGQHTGRSPNDKFVVREPSSEAVIAWGKVNRPLDPAQFDALHKDLLSSLTGKELFVLDCFAGADPAYRLPVRFIKEFAWHNPFCKNLFIDDPAAAHAAAPQFTIIDSPSFKADPKRHGSNSDVMIAVNFAKRMVLIAGTSYAGEMKKSIFSVLNYILPLQNVLPMHCSANIGRSGDVALFFGLSGTGKTTLSSDNERMLIGDDEHGWSDRGVFNFEGGCYAKTIRIHKESEPEIYAATESFGTILENVVYDPRTRVPDYDSDEKTENTRAAYPVDLIPNAVLTGTGSHPHNVMFLSADAYGVLPPVARLEEDQIRHYFLSGYTAKVAGTERGVTEPEPIFSTCFAAPFLVLPPERYAGMLIERVKKHHADVWMLNTGWVGGPYGVGERMSIAHTRAIVRAVLQGDLRGVSTHVDPVFGLHIPNRVPGVPREVLDTRDSWPNPEDYDRQAAKLRDMFQKNITMIGKSASSSG